MIEMLADGSYSVTARGNKMILRHVKSSFGQWSVTTDNASHRAYRGWGFAISTPCAKSRIIISLGAVLLSWSSCLHPLKLTIEVNKKLWL